MQEYFVYFKFLQQSYGEKSQQDAADAIVRCCLNKKEPGHKARLSQMLFHF